MYKSITTNCARTAQSAHNDFNFESMFRWAFQAAGQQRGVTAGCHDSHWSCWCHLCAGARPQRSLQTSPNRSRFQSHIGVYLLPGVHGYAALITLEACPGSRAARISSLYLWPEQDLEPPHRQEPEAVALLCCRFAVAVNTAAWEQPVRLTPLEASVRRETRGSST